MRALRQFLRDLALVPAMWRRAVSQERYRRFQESPEGKLAYLRSMDAFVEQQRRWLNSSQTSLAEQGEKS